MEQQRWGFVFTHVLLIGQTVNTEAGILPLSVKMKRAKGKEKEIHLIRPQFVLKT